MALIELNKVSLTFRVRKHRGITLKEFLVRRLYRPTRNPSVPVRALQEIDLKMGDGERIGLIGHNGSGKTTLLRLMAGIYPPSRGKLTVEGKISSLFDITLGFQEDANGWENMAYRGYLQGETPRGIRARMPEIAEFSELGDFLDMPVRCWSAGMRVRLAFAIATAIEPEVLLVDEVLSAGDAAFQKKAFDRMREMMARARLFVLASHDTDALRNFCGRIVWLEHGRVRQDGPAEEIIPAYMKFMNNGPRLAA